MIMFSLYEVLQSYHFCKPSSLFPVKDSIFSSYYFDLSSNYYVSYFYVTVDTLMDVDADLLYVPQIVWVLHYIS